MEELTTKEKKQIEMDLKNDIIDWRFIVIRDDRQLKKYLRDKNE